MEVDIDAPAPTAPGHKGPEAEVPVEEHIEELIGIWVAGHASTSVRDDSRYRTACTDLVRSVLRLGLTGSVSDKATGLDELLEKEPEMERLIAHLVVASRSTGRPVSVILDDLGRLIPTVSSWLQERELGSRDPRALAEALRVTKTIALVLNITTVHFAELLEASSARAAREKDMGLAAMADVISHELHNRLSAAMTAIEVLLMPTIAVDEEAINRVSRLVLSSIEEGLKSVEDVRTLVTTETGIDGLARTVDLGELLQRVLAELRPAAKEADVECEIVGQPLSCQVDAARVRLVLFNLIGNGIKYRDEKEKRSFVRISSERCLDGQVQLSVTDNGVGIAAEDLRGIFEPRFRGSLDGEIAGSGLGLAIVREAVTQMDGEIEVTSEVGRGATFVVRLTPATDPPSG